LIYIKSYVKILREKKQGKRLAGGLLLNNFLAFIIIRNSVSTLDLRYEIFSEKRNLHKWDVFYRSDLFIGHPTK